MHHLHTDIIVVPIKQIKQCSWQWVATLEPQLRVGLLTGFICVCIAYVCVLTVTRCLCMFLCVEIDSFRTLLSWFSKARWALDHPKLRAPKIEPWFHPLHRSGPPSSSTPTPHTVSITWALRITLWHKTRVCSLHDWARSIYSILFMNIPYSAALGDLGVFRSVCVVKVVKVVPASSYL